MTLRELIARAIDDACYTIDSHGNVNDDVRGSYKAADSILILIGNSALAAAASGGDVKQAPSPMGSAVPKADAQ